MLRALAASARPLGGRAGLLPSSSWSSWPRAFAADGKAGAAPPAHAEAEPASSSGGGGGESASSGSGSGSSATSLPPPPPPPIDGWSEVVDDASGKSYWWNQQTGQTTDLGAGRPAERFWRRQQSAGGGDGGGGGGGDGNGDEYDDPHFRDGHGVWKEPPGRDKTWTYSVIGVGIGMAAGWLTQYIH